jgi:nucleoside-diphosphate-sugar epimerase
MKVISSGLSGTIGRHLSDKGITPLSQRLDQISIDVNLGRSDIYFHLGGIVGPSLVLENLELSRQVNIKSVRELGLIARQRDIQKFVYVSTSHVYKPKNENINESDELEPINLYAEQKLEAENILREIYSDMPDRLLIIRVFSILGYDTKEFTLGGAILKLSKDPNFELRNGNDIRDFLSPKQAADMIYRLGLTAETSTTINVCTGNGMSLVDAAHQMLSYRKLDFNPENIRRENSQIPRIVGDSKKLGELLGGVPKWEYLT